MEDTNGEGSAPAPAPAPECVSFLYLRTLLFRLRMELTLCSVHGQDLDMRAKLARLFNGGCGPHIHMTDAGSDFEAQVLEAGRLVYGEPTEQARSVGEHFSNAIDRISPAVRQAAGLSAAVVASAAYRQHFRTRSRTTV